MEKTQSLIMGLALLLAAGGFGLYVWTQDAAAKHNGDYFACWTEACKSETAGAAADRMSGRGTTLPDHL